MLARPTMAEEVVNPDGLVDLYGACCRQAIRDYRAGPDVVGPAHFRTAKTFLEAAGLMERVAHTERRGRADEDAIGDQGETRGAVADAQ